MLYIIIVCEVDVIANSLVLYLPFCSTLNKNFFSLSLSEQSELTSQKLYTHVSQRSQNLQVSSYVLMYLRAVRTYKSVVMYSCISEHSELTSQ